MQEQGEGSPPPEDREFVDDDGTRFVWDATLRKFRPEDLAAPSGAEAAAAGPPATSGAVRAEYTVEMMTFGGLEREGMTLEEARAEEEASRERAEQAAAAPAPVRSTAHLLIACMAAATPCLDSGVPHGYGDCRRWLPGTAAAAAPRRPRRRPGLRTGPRPERAGGRVRRARLRRRRRRRRRRRCT